MKWLLFIITLIVAVAVFLLVALHRVPVQVPYTVVVEHNLFAPDVTRTEQRTERHLQFDTPQTVLFAVGAAVVTLLFWPIVGAMVVGFAGNLRHWAYCGKAAEFDDEDKLALAAVWPITLMYSVVVYPSMGIIHRLF